MWALRALATAAIPVLDKTRPGLSGDKIAAQDGRGAARCFSWPRSRTGGRRFASTASRSASRRRGARGGRADDAIRDPAALSQGHGASGPAGPDRGADVGPLRHAAARHRADDAARPRRLHHRLAQRARRAAFARARSASTSTSSTSSISSARWARARNLMAICQPCVAALAAVAIMSEDEHPATPASMMLMAGPIDCRIAPTAVNKLANDKPIEWFEKKLISTVPLRYARRDAARVSRLRAAVRVPEHEPRAAHHVVSRTVRGPRQQRHRKSRGDAQLLQGVLRGRRPARRVLPRDGASASSRNTRWPRANSPGAAARSTRRRSTAPRCSRSKASATTSARSGRRWPRTTCAADCAST